MAFIADSEQDFEMKRRKCEYCKKTLRKKKSESSKTFNTRKYCNAKCYWLNIKGKSFVNSGQFKKGMAPWNKSKKYKCPKSSENRKALYKNKENHPRYNKFKKNPSQHYSNVHKWLRKYFGKANKCENKKCKKISKTFVWANISGEYHRKRDDFMMLCQSCHLKADKNGGIEKSNVIYR